MRGKARSSECPRGLGDDRTQAAISKTEWSEKAQYFTLVLVKPSQMFYAIYSIPKHHPNLPISHLSAWHALILTLVASSYILAISACMTLDSPMPPMYPSASTAASRTDTTGSHDMTQAAATAWVQFRVFLGREV